jgi:hypothetical protein
VSTLADSESRKNRLDLSGNPIDDCVYGSSCTLDNIVPDILGCHHSALRNVSCLFDGSRPNCANGDGEGENDRKERFHGTKYSLLTARVRLPGGRRDCAANL